MAKKILIGVAVLVVALVAAVLTRPPTYKVERSVSIAAPAEVAFAYGADFSKFDAFSPWSELDPSMQKKIEGTPGTVGHSYWWSGNDEVGEGKMTITEITPNQLVKVKLEFVKPFPSTAQTWMAYAPDGASTKVTWGMSGNLDTVGKAMSLVMNFSEMIGKDYEKGLAKLKTVAEADAKTLAEAKAAAAEAAPAEAGAAKAAGTTP